MFLDGGGASLGTAEGRITIDVSQAQGALGSLGGDLASFDAKAASINSTFGSFSQSTIGLAQGMQNVGRATAGLGAVMEAPFVLAAKSALDLESTMAGVNAVMDITGDQFDQLTSLSQELGRVTVFSGTEVASGIEELGKAGISFEDIMAGAAEAATDLAAAGGVDVPKAAGVMAAAMQQFNIAGEESAHVADVLAGAANASLSDINQMGIGLAQVGGVANAAGMDIDETATFMAIMANNGIRGSDAATSMKNAILAMLAPTDKASKVMDSMGVSVLDTAGNFKGLEGVSRDFFEVWKDSGQTMSEFLEPLTKVLGRDAVRSILFGMQSIQDEQEGLDSGWSQMEEDVTKAGTAHEVATERMNSTAGAIEKLRGSLDVLAENLGTPLIKSIRGPIEALDQFVQKLSQVPTPILAAIGFVGSLAGAITALGGGFLVVGGYVLEATARFSAAGIAIGDIVAIAARVVLAITGIGLAAAAIAIAINTNFLGIRDIIGNVVDQIQEAADKIQQFQKLFSEGGTGFRKGGLADQISAFGHAIDAVLGTNVSDFFDLIASGVDRLEKIQVGLSHAADQMKIFTDASERIQPVAKRIDALGKVLKNVFGVDVTRQFSDAAKGIDAFAESVNELTSNRGIGLLPAIMASVGVGLTEAFGPSGLADAFLKIGSVMATVQLAFENAVNNGFNPAAAAIHALAVGADALDMDGLADSLLNAGELAQQFGDNFTAAQDAIAARGITGLPAAILALNDAMLATLGIGLPDFMIGAASAMAAFQTAVSNGIQNGLNPFEAALKGVGAAIGSIFGAEARADFFAFVDAMGGLGTAVQGLISSGFDRVGQMFSEIGTALSEGDIQGALDAVRSLIADVGAELVRAGQTAIDWAINVGAPQLIGWAKEQAGRFGEWLKEQLGIVGDAAGQTLATVKNWFIEVGIPQATGWLQQTGGDVISWVQEQLDRLIPAAGETLGHIAGWFIEVGIPEIKIAAGEAGTIKDAIIKWIGDQITFPSISELPGIHEKVQAFANDLGQNIAAFLAEAMATIRGMLGFGGGGGSAAHGADAGIGGAGLAADAESSARDVAGTVIDGFLRGLAAGFAEGVGQANVATFISSGNFEPLKAQILQALGDALAALPSQIEALVNNTKAELGGILAGIMDIGEWLATAPAQGGRPGGSAGATLTRGALDIQKPMEEAFNGLVEAVKEIAVGLPAKLIAAVGDPFAGLGEAVQAKADAAAVLIAGASDTLIKSFNDLKTGIEEVFGTAGGGGAGGAENVTIGQGATEDIIGQYADGAVQGVETGATSLQDRVGAAASAAIDLTGSFLPIGPLLRDAVSATGAEAAPAVAEGFSPFMDGVSAETTNQINTMGSEIQSAAAAAAPGSVEGIGAVIDSALSTAVDGITLEALAQAIGNKIGDAVVAGLSAASGGEAQAGLSAGTGGAANIGSQIAQALSASIQGADFTAVGTAISTQIGVALSAGFSQAQATGPSTAGIDIGSQIALALASAISGSDFTVVSTAIQQKIGQSLSGGTGGTAAQADTSAVSGEGATIGASIAAALANAILTADFSVVGQAIQQKISQAVASASSGATTGGAGAGLGGVVGQGGGIASGIVASIVSSFEGADFSGVGTAISTNLGAAITAGVEGTRGEVASAISSVIQTAMVAAESANEAGIVFSQALAGGITSTSGTIDVAASTAMTTAVTSATGIADTAAPVGTAFTTAVGAGIGSGTGTVTAAVDAMVQAGIAGGQGSAAGASAVGDSFDQAVGSGIGASAGTITGAVQAMVSAAIDAGVGAAAGASAIGAAISSGAASGVILDALVGPVSQMVSNGISAGLAAADAGSPSRKMMEQGQWLAEGMAIGIEKHSDLPVKSINRLVGRVIDSVKDFKPEVEGLRTLAASFENLPGIDQFASQISGVADHFEDGLHSVKDSMKGIIDTVRDSLKSSQDKIKGDSQELGDSAGQGFADIIKDRKQLLRGGMKDTKGTLIDLQGLQGDVGQLRLISKQLERFRGPNDFAERVAGMADTLEGERQDAVSAATDLFTQLEGELEQAKKKHRQKGREAGDEIGTGLGEGFADSAKSTESSVTSLTDTIINTFNANLDRLPEMAEAIGNATGEGLSTGLEESWPAIDKTTTITGDVIAGGINKTVPQLEGAATNAADKFTAALNAAVQGSTGQVGLSGESIGTALSDGATGMIADSPIRTAVQEFVTGLTSEVQSGIGNVSNAGRSVGQAFGTGVGSTNIQNAGKGLVDQVGTGITTGVPSVTNTAENAGNTIGSGLEAGIADSCKTVNDQANSLTDTCIPSGINSGLGAATGAAKDAGQSISDSLKNGMELRKHDVETAFKGAGTGFGSNLATGIGSTTQNNKNTVTTLTGQIGSIDAKPQGKTVGASFGAGIVEGINASTKNVTDAAAALVDAAEGAARHAGESESPSKVFMDVGRDFMLGFQMGIEDGTSGVVNAMGQSAQELAAMFAGQGLNSATNALNKNLGGYTDTVEKALNSLEKTTKRSGLLDILSPAEFNKRSANRTTAPRANVGSVDRSITINGLKVEKGSQLETMIFDMADHLQNTSGQYSAT